MKPAWPWVCPPNSLRERALGICRQIWTSLFIRAPALADLIQSGAKLGIVQSSYDLYAEATD